MQMQQRWLLFKTTLPALVLSVCFMLLGATSCSGQSSPDNLEIITLRFIAADGSQSDAISAEVARTNAIRQKGLMYRRELGAGQGMIFVFPGPDRDIQMWMKNTYISLDMVFIDSSFKVVGVLHDIPTLNLKPRTVPAKAKYLLEIAAGEAKRLQIVQGAKLHVEGTLEDATE